MASGADVTRRQPAYHFATRPDPPRAAGDRSRSRLTAASAPHLILGGLRPRRLLFQVIPLHLCRDLLAGLLVRRRRARAAQVRAARQEAGKSEQQEKFRCRDESHRLHGCTDPYESIGEEPAPKCPCNDPILRSKT